MILKFITPEWEIDFSGQKLKIVEENHWFSDQFFTKYSFPVTFDLTNQLDKRLGMLSHINAQRTKKKQSGFFLGFGKEHDGFIVIERIDGTKVTAKIRYGLEEFPNHDRKLATLNLYKLQLQESIFDYALGIIDQTWPAVKFNFPQVICDKFDTDSHQWEFYEGIINNYRAGAFLKNEYDAANDLQINRNIMQPMPYLLHVLKQGFADAGYELRGDILEDPEFKRALITVVSDYYSTVSDSKIELTVKANEYHELYRRTQFGNSGEIDYGRYINTVLLLNPGRYKVTGSVYLRVNRTSSIALLKVNSETFWSQRLISNYNYAEKYYNVDEVIDISPQQGAAAINFNSEQLPYSQFEEDRDPEAIVLDITITRVAAYDENGDLIPALISPDEIDLSKCVPDITFGELLQRVKQWRNYDIKQGDGYFDMNLIQNQMKSEKHINLEQYEVKYPIREFFEDRSYLLKFQDVNSDEYEFAQVFVDSEGVKINEFVKNESTSEIIVDAIPLPIKKFADVFTAHYFLDDNKKLALVIYEGLTNGINIAQDPAGLLIPANYDFGYEDWIDFRIHADGVSWDFKCTEYQAQQIERDSTIAAYRKYLLIKRVSKTNLSNGFWEVSLETEGQD